MRNPSLDQLADRTTALGINCRHCGAPAGSPCLTAPDQRGVRHELTNFPAHLPRLKDVAVADRMIRRTEEMSRRLVDAALMTPAAEGQILAALREEARR